MKNEPNKERGVSSESAVTFRINGHQLRVTYPCDTRSCVMPRLTPQLCFELARRVVSCFCLSRSSRVSLFSCSRSFRRRSQYSPDFRPP